MTASMLIGAIILTITIVGTALAWISDRYLGDS